MTDRRDTWDNSPLKQIERNWILITYDISASENRFRKRVIRRLRGLGARRHSQSVYYMPYSPGALAAAKQIQSRIGSVVFVWYQHLPGDEDAEYFTKQYLLAFIAGVDNLEKKARKLEEDFSRLKRKTIQSRLKGLRSQFQGLLKTADMLRWPPAVERLSQVGQRLEKLRDSVKKSRREEDRGG